VGFGVYEKYVYIVFLKTARAQPAFFFFNLSEIFLITRNYWNRFEIRKYTWLEPSCNWAEIGDEGENNFQPQAAFCVCVANIGSPWKGGIIFTKMSAKIVLRGFGLLYFLSHPTSNWGLLHRSQGKTQVLCPGHFPSPYRPNLFTSHLCRWE
jgi:hypothetical protein